MLQNQSLQHRYPNKVTAALFLILAMCRADKMILIFHRVVAAAKVHSLLALAAVQDAGEKACPSGSSAPLPFFTQFLNLVKDLLGHNCRMRIVKHKLLFHRIDSLRFVPNGICVSPEIDGTADIFFEIRNYFVLFLFAPPPGR